MTRRIIPVNDPKEIPENMTEKELQDFWSTHHLTEACMDKMGFAPMNDGPEPRQESE